MIAALVLVATAFDAKTRHFKECFPETFFSDLKRAEEDGTDGRIVAFLDKKGEEYKAQAAVYSMAAKSFKCIAPDGVWMMNTEGKGSMGAFVAGDLQHEHKLPQHAKPQRRAITADARRDCRSALRRVGCVHFCAF